ncbi:FAD-dependent monooxygenase [Pseudomonas sp. 13B_2.1_Bac1]|nr:FAD-dependent monooxygenase [Pseudomonas sp. 13B_2.1_Bac1]
MNKTPGIVLEGDRRVSSVSDLDDSVQITFADDHQQTAPVDIGADGYRSVVRRAISPEAPFARYAGYLVWRGLVEERALQKPVSWPSDGGVWIEFVGGYRFVAATLPGRDGSVQPGQRQITFAWFDAHQDELLRRTDCLTAEGHVVGTLARGLIDDSVKSALENRAQTIWPERWREAVLAGIRSPNTLSGSPIAEYLPQRLARGNMAIIGDAAHFITPMTGRGLLTAMEDASTVAQLLARRSPGETLATVLARYEQARLPFIRGLVKHSINISREYVELARA